MFTSAELRSRHHGHVPDRQVDQAPGAEHLPARSSTPIGCVVRRRARRRKGKVPFISTNDAISSWFLREMKCDVNLMVANLRGRGAVHSSGSVTPMPGTTRQTCPTFPVTWRRASMIRQSIRDPEGGFRARRAGSPQTLQSPHSAPSLRNRAAIITNWAGFYRDVHFAVDGAQRQSPQLHLPIMETRWHDHFGLAQRRGVLPPGRASLRC